MATHGKARERRREMMHEHKPFRATGAALSAVAGVADHTGRLEGQDMWQYARDAQEPGITYTVKSYATPIAWVRRDGAVVIPSTRYSATTAHHQSEAAVALTTDVPLRKDVTSNG